MRILRKGKGLLETFKCKLGYHEWVAVHWSEYNLGKPRSILKKKFGISDSSITRIINLKSKPKFGNYKFKYVSQDIIRDYQEGMLVRDICNKYSIGHTTLNNYLRRLNISRYR